MNFDSFFRLCGLIFFKKKILFLSASTDISLGPFFKSRIYFLGKRGRAFYWKWQRRPFRFGAPTFFSYGPPPADELCPFSKTIYFALYFQQEMSFFGGGEICSRWKKNLSGSNTFSEPFFPISRTLSRPLDSPHKFWILTWQKTIFPLCSLQKKIDTAVFLLEKNIFERNFSTFFEKSTWWDN